MTLDLGKEAHDRTATLRLSHDAALGQQLTAHVPLNLSVEEFSHVNRAAYDLISKLTGCNCMSGRIRFVVEDRFADVIRVNLQTGRAGV